MSRLSSARNAPATLLPVETPYSERVVLTEPMRKKNHAFNDDVSHGSDAVGKASESR
jgi:hypothetical protein